MSLFIHPPMTMPSFELVPAAELHLHKTLIREFLIMTSVVKLVLGGVPSAFPKCAFVSCHYGAGISVIKERMQRWEKTLGRSTTAFQDEFSRLYFTMGGYEISSLHLQSSLAGIGPERLMFGTDYPYDFRGGGPHLRSWVQQIRNLPLSLAAKDAILGDNAARLLGLAV